jgi:sortase (surface protein transpeptidase)
LSIGSGSRRIFVYVAGALVFGFALTALGLFVAGRSDGKTQGAVSHAARATAQPPSSPTATPGDDMLARARAIAAPAAPPARLLIPAIGVNTAVEPVGLDSQGRIGSPSIPANVGWYRAGVAPGDAGDALLDGHLDWTNGPAVFWELGKLRVGDSSEVDRADGSRVHFVVDSTSVVPYNASEDSLFTATGPPAMSLITCTGVWDQQRGTYLQRLLVHASLAPGDPIDAAGS